MSLVANHKSTKHVSLRLGVGRSRRRSIQLSSLAPVLEDRAAVVLRMLSEAEENVVAAEAVLAEASATGSKDGIAVAQDFYEQSRQRLAAQRKIAMQTELPLQGTKQQLPAISDTISPSNNTDVTDGAAAAASKSGLWDTQEDWKRLLSADAEGPDRNLLDAAKSALLKSELPAVNPAQRTRRASKEVVGPGWLLPPDPQVEKAVVLRKTPPPPPPRAEKKTPPPPPPRVRKEGIKNKPDTFLEKPYPSAAIGGHTHGKYK